MKGVECPMPPQRTRVLVRCGWDCRVSKRIVDCWRMADAQITMQSIGSGWVKRVGIWGCARKCEKMLMSEGFGFEGSISMGLKE